MTATARTLTTAAAFAAREQADRAAVAARIAQADNRCECEGSCGAPHKLGHGRCVNHHSSKHPLQLAPATPDAGWLTATRTPLAELRVWCPACLTGTARLARRDRAEVREKAQDDLFGDTWTPPRKHQGTR